MNDKWVTRIVNFTKNLPWKIRRPIYEQIGLISCGGGYDIRKGVVFDHAKAVSFGKNIMINQNVQFHIGETKDAHICIDDNVFIGMNTCFLCVSHSIGEPNKRAAKNIYSDIHVGKGSWIGANVTVLPGVSIGNGCIVAAGSVVISDCDANCLYAGNPAKKKRCLEE